MQKVVAVLFTLLVATTAFAQSAADAVRASEVAFAKAFADRDAAKFFAYVVDDASFLPPPRTIAGKAAVVERWSRFFSATVAPFSWSPERVCSYSTATGWCSMDAL